MYILSHYCPASCNFYIIFYIIHYRYAISGIVRNFPLAQKALVEFGAISAFTTIFQTDSAELAKLQLKIVTLLSDITSERSSAIAQHSEAVNATEAEMKMLQEKVQQYESAGVETVLVEQGFCRLFPRLLTQIRQDKMARREDLSSFQGRPLREEHDVVEKVVQAMISLSRSCRAHFRSVTSLIQTLNDRYFNFCVTSSLFKIFYDDISVIYVRETTLFDL